MIWRKVTETGKAPKNAFYSPKEDGKNYYQAIIEEEPKRIREIPEARLLKIHYVLCFE